MTDFVLVHSPHGGSHTWQPVAEALRARGYHVTSPTFRSTPVTSYWLRNVNAILRIAQRPRPVIVGHSGAGPLLAQAARWIDGGRCLYVDAGFRKDAGVPNGLPLTERGSGLVPAWANDADLAELLPDPTVRARLIESLAPMPRDYFAEAIPYLEPPDGSAYLKLSASYPESVATARTRGWAVREIDDSHHYTMLAEPERIAEEVLALIIP